MSESKISTILVVEDDPGHARLIEKNLRRANLANPIKIIPNGRDAIDYLLSQGEYDGVPRPSPVLMLLDLNMPEMDGRQVLEKVKGDDRTKHIPVVVLTTTGEEHEVELCYKLGCNIFVSKPVDYTSFSEAVTKLGLFLAVVTAPEVN